MRHRTTRITPQGRRLGPLGIAGAVLLSLLLPAASHAHALLHEVVDGEAVIIRLSFPGADQPLFEPYEVFAPGVATPFQSGRVNALGEVSFRPDRPGAWRVRVFAEDGHGAVIELEIDAAGAVAVVQGQHHHAHDYWSSVLAALGYLLGIFGLLALWRVRRARTGPG
jgi:nickel transport protein